MESKARSAGISQALGIAAVVAMAAGPALAQTGAATPFVGFRIFALGLMIGLLALLMGFVGLIQTRASTGRGGRANAFAGMVLGVIPIVVLAVSVGDSGGGPMITDITTNPEYPTVFRTAQELAPNHGRDMAYPGADFAEQQRAGYPDLVPIRVAGAPSAVFDRCVAAAEELGWEVTARDPAALTFEAREVTDVFHFVDDVVVRVRASGDASVVDVRSKSRDGKGDMGANAARIRAFRDAITG